MKRSINLAVLMSILAITMQSNIIISNISASQLRTNVVTTQGGNSIVKFKVM